MNIFFISPTEFITPDLFSSFIYTFTEKGHRIVENINDADIAFLDLHNRIGNYNNDSVAGIIEKKLPVVVFDFWDYGGTQDEESDWIGKKNWLPIQHKAGHWALVLKSLLFNKIKLVFFVRKMDIKETYQDFVYPIELCYYKDHDFTPVSKEELLSRPYDICFIGNTSPTRENVVNGLLFANCFKLDVQYNIEGRIPHEVWLNRHRQSKLFIEACGGGFGSERPQQLFSIAPMLRVRSSHLIANDFIHDIDCFEIDEFPTRMDSIELSDLLQDEDRLYSIYLKGINRMKMYFNPMYRSNYILSILKQEGLC